MTPSVSAAVTFAVVLGCTAPTSADPIIIVRQDGRTTAVLPFLGANQNRVIESHGSDMLVSTVSAPPPADFRGTSTATLTSSFGDPFHWTGMGRGTVALTELVASSNSANSFATAVFSVVFDVTAPVSYVFDGLGTGSVSLDAPDSPFSFAGALSFGGLNRIVVPGEDPILEGIFNFQMTGAHLAKPMSGTAADAIQPAFAGVLVPGQYWLRLDTGGSAGMVGSQPGSAAATSTFTFSLDFAPVTPTPVPEPTSLLLLGIGLAACAARRRSHRNPSPP